MNELFNSISLADYLSGYNIGVALFISIILSVLIAVAGIIPSIFVTGANVIVFGFYGGLIVSWIGEIIGAYVSFLLYRLGFKSKIDHFATKHALIKRISEGKGKIAFIYIFEGRLIPFLPSGVVTFAASVSSVGIISFVIATAIGKFPAMLLETVISYDMLNIRENYMRLLLVIVALVILAITQKFRGGMHKNE